MSKHVLTLRRSLLVLIVALFVSNTGCFRCLRRCGYAGMKYDCACDSFCGPSRCDCTGSASCGVTDCRAQSCGCADDCCEAECGCDDVGCEPDCGCDEVGCKPDCGCDEVGCGNCVGSGGGGGCCQWFKGLFGRLRSCSGCGCEIYWSEWHNDPPGCETCDCHGNWTGIADGCHAPYRHQPILAEQEASGEGVMEYAQESDTVFK